MSQCTTLVKLTHQIGHLLDKDSKAAYGSGMDEMATHIATRECPITQPHPATECGVVAARRQCQQEADSGMRRQREDEKEAV